MIFGIDCVTIWISVASTVVLGASACSNEEKPYFSEELSMEDYFNSHDEENCFMTYYIDNNKVDGKTFEEWNSIYKEARCSAIYDEKTDTYKPSSENSEMVMNRALYSMGLLILKGQIIESLNIMPGNVKDIKVISSSKEADYRAHISYTTYETKKATGNIDTKVMTEKKVEYLEKRVSHLETIERNRKIRAIVTLIMRILVYIAIGIALVFAWNYVNENYIKPYKEQYRRQPINM